MVRTADHKLVFVEETGEPVQLFDLQADPHENLNVVGRGDYRKDRDELMENLVTPFLSAALARPGPRMPGQR